MRNSNLRVLVIDDDADDIERIRNLLLSVGASFGCQGCGWQAIPSTELVCASYDVVLLALPKSGWAESLELAKPLFTQAPLVVLNDTENVRRELRAVRAGAQDFLVKANLNSALLKRTVFYARERFKLRQQLQASHARYQAVVEDQTELICRCQADTTLTFVNQAYARFFKRSVEDLVGTQLLKLIPKASHDTTLGRLASLTPDAPVAVHEQPLLCEGKQGWQEWTNRALFDASGKLIEIQSIGRDITDRKNAEQQVLANEMRHRMLYQNTPVMMHVIDETDNIIDVNQQWLKTLGYTRDAVLGRPPYDFLTRESAQKARANLETVKQHGQLYNQPYQFVTRTGEPIDVLLSANIDNGADKQNRHVLAVAVDITARLRAEAALVEEKERLRITLQSIGDAVITTDAIGQVDYLNPVAERLTDWSLAEAFGKPTAKVMQIVNERTRKPIPDPTNRCLEEQRVIGSAHHAVLVSRTGKEYSIQVSAAPIRDVDGRIAGAVLIFSDVTRSRELTREIARQAAHDALTGLINRREFERRLARVLDANRTEISEHALCYLDLDQFKIVNDSCGHAAGDELLCQIAQLFQQMIRTRDTLARLGGDEFAVLMEHCPTDAALQVAHQLRRSLEEFRFHWDGKTFRLAVSIGLVPLDSSGNSVGSVLRAADSACYAAKDAGRNRVHVYRADDIELAQRHGEMQWINRLQHALDNERFMLVAQTIAPIQHLAAPGQGAHMEVLLRLRDEQDRMVLPGAFLPAAERYHFAERVDRWVVRTALHWLAEHRQQLDLLNCCAINLSGQSLGDEMHSYVLALLNDTQLPADKICFEITETAAVSNLSDATRFMAALKQRGCRFALDDFGSGLSSFGYLKNLPVDFLKIDGLFVKDLLDDPIDFAMVRSINEIGQLMGKQTIAEYVESAAIFDGLSAIGVNLAQGFGIGEPQLLDDWWRAMCADARPLLPAAKEMAHPDIDDTATA